MIEERIFLVKGKDAALLDDRGEPEPRPNVVGPGGNNCQQDAGRYADKAEGQRKGP